MIEKTEEYLFCEFEYNDSEWQQDFPRDSVRLGEGQATVFETLINSRNLSNRKEKKVNISMSSRKKKSSAKRKTTRKIELTPPPVRR